MKRKMKLFYIVVLLWTFFLTGCACHIPLEAPLKPFINPISTTIHDRYTHYLSCDKPVKIICKPLMLFDLGFPPNENILSINTGDSERWLFQSIVSNTENAPITHLLIKPKENNINTNLIVATNRRVYRIDLVSREASKQENSITFVDPIAQTSCINRLDNRYEVSIPFFQKIPSWLPKSIYNDNKSVFITIPNLNRCVAPTFYILDDQNQPTVVNYQVINNCYRVDQLFIKGLLIQGVGARQQKVLIKYTGVNEL